jgi:hypothetical protein
MAGFRYIFFGEHLGDDPGDLNSGFPFVGFQSSVKSFEIPGQPVDGYFLVAVNDLQKKYTRTLINGQTIPHTTIQPGGERHHVWFCDIPRGMLVQRTNTIQFKSGDKMLNDNFEIWQVVVHWREESDKPDFDSSVQGNQSQQSQ